VAVSPLPGWSDADETRPAEAQAITRASRRPRALHYAAHVQLLGAQRTLPRGPQPSRSCGSLGDRATLLGSEPRPSRFAPALSPVASRTRPEAIVKSSVYPGLDRFVETRSVGYPAHEITNRTAEQRCYQW